MPEYTSYLNLYKPNQADDIQVDTSLADNFQKIDDAIADIGTATGFNVLEYGADPTGVASSRSAIQNAIDDAETAGGGIVIIPAGTYLSDARINLRSNVTVRGEGLGTVINGTGTATPIAFTYAHKCYVDSVDIRHTTEGSCVSISNSFQCEVRRVSVHYSSSSDPTEIYSRNALKINGGCQQVGYRECHVENGTQSIDITFSNNGTVNTQCFIDGCTVVGATTNAMTSHGGNYMTSITNNKFINCRGEGVMLRGRKNLVANNIIQKPYSTLDTEAVGLKFYQGWARDNQVSGNFISGFQIGLYINDTSQTDDSRFKYMGCNIVSNTFDNCRWGIFLYREETNKHSGYVGVNITGNKFVNPPSDGAKGIEIDCYIHGVYIADNVFDMNGVTNACIYAQPNAGAVHVIGNVFNYTTAYGFWHAGVTDTTFWSSRPRMFLKDNISNGIPSGTYNLGSEIRVNRHKSAEVAVNTHFFDDDDSANPKFKNNSGAIRTVNFT